MYNGSESPLTALMEQLGGDHQFHGLMMTLAQACLRDRDLEVSFKGMGAEALAEHFSNLIQMAFGYACKSSMSDRAIRGQIVLRNYSLFDLNLSPNQLQRLQLHFEDTMEDFMVQGEVFEHCQERFTDLCKVLAQENQGLNQSNADASMDPARIMMARSASRHVFSARSA